MAVTDNQLPSRHENPVSLYILEILSACLICYLLYACFPQYNLIWAIIYIPVVVSPIREKSRSLVFSRIKANFLGALLGFFALLISGPAFISLSIGAVAVIILCNALKIMETARSALLTMVAVIIPHYSEPAYDVALERTVSVTCGCLIALIVIVSFEHVYLKSFKTSRETDENAD